MFCSECGKELREGALFCPSCGCKVEQPQTEEKPSVEFEEIKEILSKTSDNKQKMITIGAIAAGVIVCILVVVFFGLPKGEMSSNADGKGNVLATETESESANAEYLSAYYNDTILKATPELNIGDRDIVYTYGGMELVNDAPSMQAGVVAHRISDIDNDSEEELLTIYSSGTEYYASVYEVENQTVVKKSEMRIGDVSNFPSFSTDNISLVENGSEKYILYTRQESAALAEGYSAEVSMWSYHGTNIVPVMDIIQTEGGSEYWEYTATHYDSIGNIIESNVIYRACWEPAQNITDDDGSLMAGQFSRYGITIKPNMSMFEDLENILADSVNKEQLYRFDMWVSKEPGSFDGDTEVIVYFNDANKDSNKVYEQYRYDVYYILEEHYDAPYGYEFIEYCFYDMNGDGWDEMVVRECDTGIFAYLTEYHIYAWVDSNMKCVAEGNHGEWGAFYPTANGYYESLDRSDASNGTSWGYETSYAFNGVGFDVVASWEYEEIWGTGEENSSCKVLRNGVLVDASKEECESMHSPEIGSDVWNTLTTLDDVKFPEVNTNVSNTNNSVSNAADYVLPNSNVVYLTKSDLAGFGPEVCRVARNEIYARHGRIFTDEILKAYFESKSWYYGTVSAEDFSDDVLNEYEIANRDLILEYEKEQGYR